MLFLRQLCGAASLTPLLNSCMSAYYCILLHCARHLNGVVCTGSPKLVSEIMALGMEGRHTEAQRTQRLLFDADYLGMT